MQSPEPTPAPTTVERTLVRVGSYTMIAVGAVGTLNNLALGLEPISTATLAGIAIAGVALALAERRGAKTVALAAWFVGTTALALVVSWLPGGGVRGSVTTVLPILVSAGILVLPSRAALPFLGALASVVLALVGLEWCFPDLASPMPPRPVWLLDSTTAAVVAIVMVGLSTLAMRRAYERDREALERASASLRDAHTELEDALEAARAANDAKSRFLANMSHELRTPLAGVVGRLELLGGTPLTEAAHRHVESIRRSTVHLRGLIDDLLDLGRIERDDFVLASNPVRLASLVSDVCADTRVESGPAVEGWVDPELPEAIVGDALRLRQIATNLVANAVRHARARRIELRMEAAGPSSLRIVVRDDGRGIDDVLLPRLFDPFVRGDGSAVVGGLGLGLYVVRRVVDAMGGELTVATSDRGATFTVTLEYEPLRLAPLPARDSVPNPAPGLRVLSAEDDGTLRVMLAAMFDELGVDAVMVPDGVAAVERAASERFDAVFLDMNMPGLTGPAAAARIVEDDTRRGRPVPRLVALTASAYAEDVATCQRAGMTHFLAKPVTLADLRRALSGLEPPSA